jgi:alkaline phosphatase
MRLYQENAMRKRKKTLIAAFLALTLTGVSGCSLFGSKEPTPAETEFTIRTYPAETTEQAPTTPKATEGTTPDSDPAESTAEITSEPTETSEVEQTQVEPTLPPETTPEPVAKKKPKYIFLFIGDGMGVGHVQAASYYKAAEGGGKKYDPGKTSYAGTYLNFEQFPVVGSVTNYNADSFITDSAAAITAITTGFKTSTDAIGVDPSGTERLETITEKVKKLLGYKVGVVSNANINHATPAGYYGHQTDRTMYYELGKDMLASGFDYFGGGSIRQPTGADGTLPDLYEMAAAQGYHVFRDNDAALAGLNGDMGKVLITSQQRAEGDAMKLRVDAQKGDADLAAYVEGGLKVLGDQEGFFYAIEGGLIDWAAHENDLGAVVREVLDLEKAVGVAMDFYNAHPDETLILVTADHETGGLGLGYSNMGYELYLNGLKKQNLSYWQYMRMVALEYRPNKTSWDTVLWEMRSHFGLTVSGTYQAGDDPKLVLNEEEVMQLNAAYLASMQDARATLGTAAYESYGAYEPLAFTVTSLLGKKCGVKFSTIYHTAQPIPIYAIGAGSEEFSGVYDNTQIAVKLEKLLGID